VGPKALSALLRAMPGGVSVPVLSVAPPAAAAERWAGEAARGATAVAAPDRVSAPLRLWLA
jgi:hypothetical protein